MSATPLQFLSFELSEDTAGECTLDAEASTAPAQADAVQAEVAQVLAWLRTRFGEEGPVEDGHAWHHALHTAVEAGRDHPWHTLALTVSARPDCADALLAQFGESDA